MESSYLKCKYYSREKFSFFTVLSMYLNSKWPQRYFCGWVKPIKRCSSALLTGNTLKLMSLYQTLFESGFLDHVHLQLSASSFLIRFCIGKVSHFFWDVWQMSPKSRKSDKNFWTYLCTSSNFRFAIGSDRILTSFWFRAYKSNIDLVMENTLFVLGIWLTCVVVKRLSENTKPYLIRIWCGRYYFWT